MGWGEVRDRGAGTTGEIEEAHKALDRLLIKNGPLAVRTLETVRILEDKEEQEMDRLIRQTKRYLNPSGGVT